MGSGCNEIWLINFGLLKITDMSVCCYYSPESVQAYRPLQYASMGVEGQVKRHGLTGPS
jgi:hypothetical protein